MSGVNGVGSVQQTQPALVGSVEAGTTEVPSLLPQPAIAALFDTGDPGAIVAALAIESGQAEKQVSRQVEQTESSIQQREDAAQVAAMHKEASDMRVQAVGTGVAGAISGGLSLAGSSYAAGSSGREGFDDLGKLAGTGRDVIAQYAKAANEDSEANIAQHQHNASDAGRAASQAYDNEREGQKLVDSALDFYKEYSSSYEQSKMAALHQS